MVGLLPGSRDREVARHLPIMMAAAGRLARQIDGIRFMVSVAPGLSAEGMKKLLPSPAASARISWVEGGTGPIFSTCDLVVAASGTVSLEAALACVPMVVIYRVSPVSYLLGRALIKVAHISLVNLIAKEEIAPELVQHDAHPRRIAETVRSILETPGALERFRKQLEAVKSMLGTGGASLRTAEIGLRLLDRGFQFQKSRRTGC